MSKKNSALIGIGYWGKVHLKYLLKNKNVFLKKIFYRKNFHNLKKFSNIKNIATKNMRDILNDKFIKYVDIVTPIETHAPLAIKFLKKNKNVLVEKPLIMNKKQEKEITKLIYKKKNLLVSYPYIYSNTLKFARNTIKKNKLGNLKYLEINLQQCGRFMKYNVNYLLGPHALSILSIFFDIKKVKFKLHKIINNKGYCETSFISCFKNNKVIATINISLNYANKNSKKIVNLYCSKGTIICDLNEQKNTFTSFKYKRIKKNNYKIAVLNKYLNKKFDENNNMQYVLKNFYSNNFYGFNFMLTKKINEFLKNA